MFNYNGHNCDVCNEKFTPQSDVVVCPECGTPHHRECYKQLGHCVNEAKHAEGFVWQAPQRAVNPNVTVCPKCQTENPKDAMFCEQCGIALTEQQKKNPHTPPFVNDIREQVTGENSPFPAGTFDGDIDGISYKDMAVYIGPSSAYYVYNFKRLQREGKRARIFCWSAFFFDGLYYLYRKMWLEAIVILLIGSLLALPSTLIMMETMGLIPATSPLLFSGIETAATGCSIISFMFKMWLGLIAVSRYKKKVVKDLKKIRQNSQTSAQYYQTIMAKSGPSKIVLILGIIMGISYLFI
ncbi:MAG: zinc-ribbon domain-containing protein [Ruminococcaceae bacterium]|nr:zinc-ribbon domain-containing protein [Oscillospiraceae bacterium]